MHVCIDPCASICVCMCLRALDDLIYRLRKYVHAGIYLRYRTKMSNVRVVRMYAHMHLHTQLLVFSVDYFSDKRRDGNDLKRMRGRGQ